MGFWEASIPTFVVAAQWPVSGALTSCSDGATRGACALQDSRGTAQQALLWLSVF